jgi:hypothetical protein
MRRLQLDLREGTRQRGEQHDAGRDPVDRHDAADTIGEEGQRPRIRSADRDHHETAEQEEQVDPRLSRMEVHARASGRVEQDHGDRGQAAQILEPQQLPHERGLVRSGVESQ